MQDPPPSNGMVPQHGDLDTPPLPPPPPMDDNIAPSDSSSQLQLPPPPIPPSDIYVQPATTTASAAPQISDSTTAPPAQKKDKESEKKKKKPPRFVQINDQVENAKHKYSGNYVTTTKYKWWNFVFLFLWQQFLLYHNIFFVAVMIVSLIPGISPTTPVTSVLPVIFILGSAALREIFDDVKRLVSDRRANNRRIKVFRHGAELTVSSSSIKVGDFVIVKCDEEFPTDLLALASSDAAGSIKIETASLDGYVNYNEIIMSSALWSPFKKFL